jgi:hypothetical protein
MEIDRDPRFSPILAPNAFSMPNEGISRLRFGSYFWLFSEFFEFHTLTGQARQPRRRLRISDKRGITLAYDIWFINLSWGMPFKDIWLKSFKSLVFSKKFCNVL